MLLTIAECVHGTVCGECSKNDNSITGLDGQSDYVASALCKYEELSKVHNIAGVIYYELLDQARRSMGWCGYDKTAMGALCLGTRNLFSPPLSSGTQRRIEQFM